jgi:hypothetical protein
LIFIVLIREFMWAESPFNQKRASQGRASVGRHLPACEFVVNRGKPLSRQISAVKMLSFD